MCRCASRVTQSRQGRCECERPLWPHSTHVCEQNCGHVDVVRELLNRGDMNGNVEDLYRHRDSIEITCRRAEGGKLDANIKDCDGRTALYMACREDHSRMLSVS